LASSVVIGATPPSQISNIKDKKGSIKSSTFKEKTESHSSLNNQTISQISSENNKFCFKTPVDAGEVKSENLKVNKKP
jgi:hypothetical protein